MLPASSFTAFVILRAIFFKQQIRPFQRNLRRTASYRPGSSDSLAIRIVDWFQSLSPMPDDNNAGQNEPGCPQTDDSEHP